MLKNYKELKVWQRSYQLCLQTYGITKEFPEDERYGLSSQMRRAAVSVPSNIAEGYGRKTTQDYIRFLHIAYGSNCELETQILLGGDLGYIEAPKLEILRQGIGEVERMLKALIRSLERKHSTPWAPCIFLRRKPQSWNPFLQLSWRKICIKNKGISQ
ncbi:MAG: four helix bundle protein [Thermodesulfobacteriota bacterium]|nr:four helix bundle protein [Thermodesulfobacteriota bacterium]